MASASLCSVDIALPSPQCPRSLAGVPGCTSSLPVRPRGSRQPPCRRLVVDLTHIKRDVVAIAAGALQPRRIVAGREDQLGPFLRDRRRPVTRLPAAVHQRGTLHRNVIAVPAIVTLHAKWRGFFHIIWRSAEASNGAAESQRTLPTRAASRQCVVPTHTLLQGVSLCQNRTFTVHFRQSCRPKSLI